MSTHPNVILMAVLTPHGLARKTMAAILAEAGVKDDEDISIGGTKYHTLVMEDSYDQGWQISAKEADLVFFKLVTYGYGEVITWLELERLKTALEAWANKTAAKHQCDVRIDVTANYW